MKVVIYGKIINTQGVYSVQTIHKNMVLGLLAYAGDHLYMTCDQHYGSDQDTEVNVNFKVTIMHIM